MAHDTLIAAADAYLLGRRDHGLSKDSDLIVIRETAPTRIEAVVYTPVICLILRGAKEAVSGGGVHSLTAGDLLLVSHDTPVTARITEASHAAPYLAVILPIDVGTLRGLYEDVGDSVSSGQGAGAMQVMRADAGLIEALSRYLALEPGTPEARVMAPMLKREVHFRLLFSPIGGMLQQLLSPGSHASKIARSIAEIRRDFRAPLRLPDLARSAGMGQSAFHFHFKAITGTSPLQYQKDIRLTEARRLLSDGDPGVAEVGYAVGYESSAQFSREYARKFGASPREDRKRQAGSIAAT